MFKIAKTPRFTHVVPIKVPVDGGFDEQTIRATFEVITDDEFASFDTMTAEGLKDLVRKILVRLDDMVDEQGKPLPYSDDLRDQLLELPYMRLGLLRGYQAAMIGAKAGN